jgi:exodeoxyribonuclease VII large subunit
VTQPESAVPASVAAPAAGAAASGVAKSTAESPWPVRVVSQKIGEWIARLGTVWAEGQITQLNRRPGAAYVFLTLRDPAVEVSLTVVAPKNVVAACDPPLREGARVIVNAKPDWYPARGTLSLRAVQIRQVGLGELLARLDKLKRLLAAEGLFAVERKRPLPFLPRRIGLITGRASAAERDVVENARLRLPSADFEIREVPVQGPTAVTRVMAALAELDADPDIEVIVLARGGGSVEDLLPFSDETLCRAIFAAKTPVVSAIGHEQDNPLCDHVADVRCSTPTDAGKRVVPDFAEERRGIDTARHRLRQALGGMLDRQSQALSAMRSRPCLARPHLLIDDRQSEVDLARQRIRRAFGNRLESAERDMVHLRSQLRALSPQQTLDRGYAIVQRDGGEVVRASTEVESLEELRVRLARGELTVIVEEQA